MSNRYTKLAADGSALPDDASDHKAVQIDNPLLASPIIVTAYRSPKPLNWEKAKAWAESLDINGWKWRLPTLDEANFIPDRTKYPAYDKNFFPDCEGEWIWTSTPAAYSPRGCAWVVAFDGGGSSCGNQSGGDVVRAVRSS